MTLSRELFDREVVVNAIIRDCLEAGTSSAVIVGAPMVGKSKVLRHVACRPAASRTLFCQIDVHTLRATLAPGAPLSDHAFLERLLQRLLPQVQDSVRASEDARASWLKESAQIRAQLDAAGPKLTDAATHQLRGTLSLVEQELRDLDLLRAAADAIERLLHSGGPLSSPQVVGLFDLLQAGRRRVLLFIDDFDLILRSGGLTDTLFQFLRGMSNEGKILAVVSSGIQLMDPSLHPPDGQRERAALFNHFQMQLLTTFTESEADAFLDWLSPLELPLSAGEKEYLRELGGGSPHFLSIARQQFLEHGRPASGKARKAFETERVMPFFEPGFQGLLLRCGAAERAVLRSVSTGTAPQRARETLRLKREGFLTSADGELRLFSRLFDEFVKAQPDEEVAEDLKVKVVVPHDAFPTSLYFANPSFADPVSFVVENSTTGVQNLQLKFDLEDYSFAAQRAVSIGPRRPETVSMALTLKDTVRRLEGPRHVQAVYQAVQETPGGGRRTLLADGLRVLLLPLDHFVFARRDVTTKRLRDFTWVIAAWVQRDAAALRPIREEARRLCQLRGYQVGAGAGVAVATAVREQVSAMYQAVATKGLRYESSALVFHQDQNHYAQRVRLPAQSVADGVMNCLDSAVLFASLFSACEIHPIILLRRGHALVGWKVADAPTADWEFIEATLVGQAPFDTALQKGREAWHEAKPLCDQWLATRPDYIPDPTSFAIPVDIHEVLRTRKLAPLSGA